MKEGESGGGGLGEVAHLRLLVVLVGTHGLGLGREVSLLVLVLLVVLEDLATERVGLDDRGLAVEDCEGEKNVSKGT
jgi:hypothetical protein